MVLPTNKWFTASAIAILLPITLLAAFKLTGIINEPQTPETIMQDPVIWNMERPSHTENVDYKIEKPYADEGMSMVLNLLIASYDENASRFYNKDYFTILVGFNATAPQVSLISVTHYVQPCEKSSTVILRDSNWRKVNMDVINTRYSGTENEKAYSTAKVTGLTCCWEIEVYWIFDDENICTHQLNITSEILYLAISGYKNVVSTFILEVLPDTGNYLDSQNVRQISYGSYLASIYHANDPIDFYKIWLEKGESISVTLSPSAFFDIDLYVYNPDKNLISRSCNRGTIPEKIDFTADKSGFWFIQIVYFQGSSGTYTLKISQKS